MGALDGIRVLEFTHFISGPMCCQILADHGAEVIKIEPPGGDISRKSLPDYEGDSLYFAAMNRNKRGISLDLKSPKGKAAIERLVKTADVIVTNYSPGVPERLGIDYEQASRINPSIVMTHITGFGMTGPHKENSAFDGIIQARSGIVHLTGEASGPPMIVGLYIADHLAGYQGAIGTLLALSARNKTGKGQFVDVSMLDSMATLLHYHLAEYDLLGHIPKRRGNRFHNNFGGMFSTKDGHIVISPTTDKKWEAFCKALDRPEWTEPDSPFSTRSGRLENYMQLEELVKAWFQERTTDEALERLEKEVVPCGPVRSVEDLLHDPQLKARDMLYALPYEDRADVIVPGVPVKLSDSGSVKPSRPPKLGEHTARILAELAFTEDEIAQMTQHLTQ